MNVQAAHPRVAPIKVRGLVGERSLSGGIMISLEALVEGKAFPQLYWV